MGFQNANVIVSFLKGSVILKIDNSWSDFGGENHTSTEGFLKIWSHFCVQRIENVLLQRRISFHKILGFIPDITKSALLC
jgi:hypothetical protein